VAKGSQLLKGKADMLKRQGEEAK